MDMEALLEDGGAPFTSAGGATVSFQWSLPQGEGKGDTHLLGSFVLAQEKPLFLSAGRLRCSAFDRSAAYILYFSFPHIITIWWSRLHADSHTSVMHTDCKHAHWTISPRSLTRGCLLLRNEFSWPINYFLPGKALHDDNYDNDMTVIMTW